MTILDPFAGCGTTLVEGLESGQNVVGMDINGLATLLQRVYTYPYRDGELNSFNCLYLELDEHLKQSLLKAGNSNQNIAIPNVAHWFNRDAQTVLHAAIEKLKFSQLTEPIKDLARLAISRIIVKISRQKSDTQYMAIEKAINRASMMDIILDSFETTLSRFQSTNRNWTGVARIILGDARSIASYQDVKNVDLVITSPPYPNSYEYWLYHKYRMYWLGLDPLWSRSKEIGARPFYSGGGKLGPWDFQNDIRLVLEQIYRVTSKSAIQFWVVGDSIIKGQLIDNSKLIATACKMTGWKVIDVLKRDVKRTSSSFQGIGRLKREDILVITKQ